MDFGNDHEGAPRSSSNSIVEALLPPHIEPHLEAQGVHSNHTPLISSLFAYSRVMLCLIFMVIDRN